MTAQKKHSCCVNFNFLELFWTTQLLVCLSHKEWDFKDDLKHLNVSIYLVFSKKNATILFLQGIEQVHSWKKLRKQGKILNKFRTVVSEVFMGNPAFYYKVELINYSLYRESFRYLLWKLCIFGINEKSLKKEPQCKKV